MANLIERIDINGKVYELPKSSGGGAEVDLTEINNKINEKLAKTTFESYTSTTRNDIISLDENKANKSEAVGSAKYNSSAQTIDFYSVKGDKLNTSIDASVFLKNGMVQSVEITKGTGVNEGEDVLKIIWNTAAGLEPIEISLSDIFNADNYYTKKDIDDKVKVFETYEEYDEAIKNLTDIHFIEETKTIVYNGVEYAASNTWKIFDEPESDYMEIAVYNKNTSQLEVYSDLELEELNSINDLVPVGVVVIPKSHDVYGDGSCGVMSLVSMSLDTPEVGNVGKNILDDKNYQMCLGTTGHGLTSHQYVPHFGNVTGPWYSEVQGQVDGKCQFPTDIVLMDGAGEGIVCPTDPLAKNIKNDKDTTRFYGPSPYYNKDRNDAYYENSSKCTDNALGYFNGFENTEVMLSNSTAQSDWKTSESIINGNTSGYYPAACCCWRYHTEGTGQGDWYLPSIGELGYVGVRFGRVRNTLEYIDEKFGGKYTTEIDFSDMQNIWSSTYKNDKTHHCLSTRNSSVAGRGVDQDAQVRAFLKLKY